MKNTQKNIDRGSGVGCVCHRTMPAADVVKTRSRLRAALEQGDGQGRTCRVQSKAYNKIVATLWGRTGSVAAASAVHIGQCYDKLRPAGSADQLQRLMRGNIREQKKSGESGGTRLDGTRHEKSGMGRRWRSGWSAEERGSDSAERLSGHTGWEQAIFAEWEKGTATWAIRNGRPAETRFVTQGIAAVVLQGNNPIPGGSGRSPTTRGPRHMRKSRASEIINADGNSFAHRSPAAGKLICSYVLVAGPAKRSAAPK